MRLKVLEYDLSSKKEIKNKKIVLLSDIHYVKDYNKNILINIINYLKKIKPNYICITGDLVDSSSEYSNLEIYYFFSWIKELGTISNVLISIGNHDLMKITSKNKIYDYNKDWIDKFNSLNNVYVLDNSNHCFNEINFIGYTVPFDFYKSKEQDLCYIKGTINEIISLVKKNKYNVLLCHSPFGILNDNILNKYLIDVDIDLILCGHTHGGMMPSFINGNRGVIAPSKNLFPKNVRGIIKYNGMDVIISYGVVRLARCTKFLRHFDVLYSKNINIIRING